MTPEIIRKICTRCYHYYENYNVYSERSKRMRTEKLCRSPHLGQSMVDGKNHEVSAEYERSCDGQCGPDGEYFELCVSREAKGWFGSAYGKDAVRVKANWEAKE